MPVKLFLDFLEKQREAAAAELEKYKTTQNTESLHQFRVHLKKLKAGLQVLASRKKTRGLQKARGVVRKVFLEAGEVREKELIEHWLKRHRMQTILSKKQIHQHTQKAKAGLSAHYKKYEKKLDKISGFIREAMLSISDKDLDKYWTSLEKEWQVNQAMIPPSTQWHDRRKLAKKILYTLNAFPARTRSSLLPARNLNALDQLQDAIGQWHDEVLLKNWLLQTRRKNAKNEKALTEALSQALQKINQSLSRRSAEVSAAFSKTKPARLKLQVSAGR